MGIKIWQKRYFVLSRAGLRYYTKPDTEVRRNFDIDTIIDAQPGNKSTEMQLQCAPEGYVPPEIGSSGNQIKLRMLMLAAESERDRDFWLDRIRKAIAARRLNRMAIRAAIDLLKADDDFADGGGRAGKAQTTTISLRKLLWDVMQTEQGSIILAECGLRRCECDTHFSDADIASIVEPLRKN
eukprot:CAMPEP_0113674726 /NCGR_PEP_ID=MMETSP0038_2-20120614/7598_1 /TAXON_ID=2898 /ORGANISM="Cryptomonas paramecium" /LENGTH=182 /DNA_ID=CAMNT_0000591377 /DNA_START=147 /DNA_END=692 /DNA_ORIENTATION=- /assembly_acc=CAM_ASM_000170